MGFWRRKWTDGEMWAMGIAAAVVIAGLGALWGAISRRDVLLEVARSRDLYGRCVDAEVRLTNMAELDAEDIVIAFDVDYFTRRGDVILIYGDEVEILRSPSDPTLLKRTPYRKIPVAMDSAAGTLSVPRLQSGQAVHLFFGGESIADYDAGTARLALLSSKTSNLQDKPRVLSATRKDGRVVRRLVADCSSL